MITPLTINYFRQLTILWELARSSRSFCELSGRSEAVVSDVIMALVEMGVNIESLIPYAKRLNRITLPTPSTMPRSTVSRILQAGEKKTLPTYIPEHYPPFPDPHTYIRTPTHRQPITEYEIIREKAATQKRDTERALTRFIAKTGSTNSLYPDDASLFPLIACKTSANPVFSSLLFTDQIFDEEEVENTTKNASPPYAHEDSENPKDSNADNDVMDNPYLRPAKMLRRKKK
ncbi:hypothetical protein JTE90_009772 [Oedothorax gibbosus]|uniref:Transcription initiation factor TFIID subunit 8 n=1 Tax=Oedothorax gibbosus TaxID=931172 RepID=A0AAV6VAQ5_9ARAC|nr:hypothetical protein JTE90_009772 [Oedothorax gibbosus]